MSESPNCRYPGLGVHPDGCECSPVRVPHLPSYVFREGVEPLAYQVWRSDESAGVIHEACANDATEREFPLYADDLECEAQQEAICCDTCDGVIAGGPLLGGKPTD